MKPLLLFAGLALAVFVGVEIYLAGLNELPPPPASPPIVFQQGDAKGRRIHFPSWSADYDKIVTNQDQTLLDVDGVHHGLIYKKGKPYLRVRATHLTVNTISHDFSSVGPLHVETIDAKPHRSFDTNSAIWSDASQLLSMPQRVTIDTGADSPLIVESLTFNVKKGEIELRKVAGPIRFK